jgi:hypothetical protein
MFRAIPVLAILAVSCGVADSSVGSDDLLSSDDAALRKNNPCATVRCAAGTECKAKGQRAECVPVDPIVTCASVLCITGTVCVDGPSGPRCIAQTPECTVDSDCRLEDNYCGGCNCLALATTERAPTCSDPVACFAAPCSVSNTVAACVNGQCVAAPR